jgi:hypothetical protein
MAYLAKLPKLLLTLALMTVAGCVPSPGVNEPTPVDGPAHSITTPQREDKTFAKAVEAAGFDAGIGAFATLTTSTVEVVNGHTFIVRQDFPNGATASTAIHLFTGGGGTPGQPPRVRLVSMGETAVRYTFSYAIAAADLPADLRAQVQAGLPVGPPSTIQRDSAVAAFAAPAGGVRAPAEDTPTVIDAIVDGVMVQSVGTGIDKVIDTTQLDKDLAHTSWAEIQAGYKAWIAFQASERIKAARDKIRAVRDCAENPTNELTRKHYEENPGAKEEVLRQLDALSDEVTVSEVATLVAMFVDSVGGFIKAAPWLGFITGPAVNYITNSMDSRLGEYVKTAEQMVPKCTRYRITGDGDSLLGVQPTVIDGFGTPFAVKGVSDKAQLSWAFTPSDRGGRSGAVRLTGSGRGGSTITAEGNYTITATSAGRFELTWVEHLCISPPVPGIPCRDLGHRWMVTPID